MKQKKRRSVDKYFVFLLLGDQLLKALALNFSEVRFNQGVGFGMMIGDWPTLVVVLVMAGLIYWYKVNDRVGERFLIIGGISNLIDRLVHGGVVDYLYVEPLWFNLADVYINVGLVLVIFYTFSFGSHKLKLGNGSNL